MIVSSSRLPELFDAIGRTNAAFITGFAVSVGRRLVRPRRRATTTATRTSSAFNSISRSPGLLVDRAPLPRCHPQRSRSPRSRSTRRRIASPAGEQQTKDWPPRALTRTRNSNEAQGINPIEQHVEKVVIVLTILVLLAVIAQQFLAPTKSKSEATPCPPARPTNLS